MEALERRNVAAGFITLNNYGTRGCKTRKQAARVRAQRKRGRKGFPRLSPLVPLRGKRRGKEKERRRKENKIKCMIIKSYRGRNSLGGAVA